MVEINTNSNLPGVGTSVESASTVGVNVSSPAEVGIVGQADLSDGIAEPNTGYRVTTPVKARTLFGSGSLLAEAVVDALQNGAYPVYAVATEEIEVVDEDLSNLAATTGTLANTPVIEDADQITFTIDGSEHTTILTYSDPSNKNPAENEVYVNPVTGEFHLDSAPSDTGSVAYIAFDYSSALEVIADEYGEEIDFLGVVNENEDVATELEQVVSEMVQNYKFAIGVTGAAARIEDLSAYSNPFDTSRMQLLYPSRNSDDESVIGAYLGMRAQIGLESSGINKRLSGQTDLAVSLSKDDQEVLVENKVSPLADESRGARVVDSPTCVSDENLEEANMSYVFSRMVVDFVTEIVYENSDNFIGRLHTSSARSNLESIIVSELKNLLASQAILGFTVTVEEEDALTASVDVGVEVTKPLRNIEATITAGDVEA